MVPGSPVGDTASSSRLETNMQPVFYMLQNNKNGAALRYTKNHEQ